MKPSLEEYCRAIDEKAEHFAREETRSQQNDHLRAFNFGRMIQRAENTRRGVLLQIAWLVTGLLLGTIFGFALSQKRGKSILHSVEQQRYQFVEKARR